LALYAIIFGEYVRVYGLNVLRYAYYVVDSTNISVEKYVKAFRRLSINFICNYIENLIVIIKM